MDWLDDFPFPHEYRQNTTDNELVCECGRPMDDSWHYKTEYHTKEK